MGINWDEIRKIAYGILDNSSIMTFPFSIYKLLTSFNNIKLVSYSDVMKTNSREQTDKLFPLEAQTVKKGNKYYIFYNDSYKNSDPRIRFSLAHELGHVSLNHFSNAYNLNDIQTISKKTMSDKEYENSEIEANFFASELLSPKVLINLDWSVEKIARNFGVSIESATKSFDFIHNNDWFNQKYKHLGNKFTFSPTNFYEKISSSLANENEILSLSCTGPKYYFCTQCKSTFKNIDIQHCPICNHYLDKIDNVFKFIELKGREIMNYSKIPVNTNGVANVCPRCGNENTQHYKYCEICGAMLINQCTGSINPYCNPKDFEDLQFSCEDGQHLSGQARYCPFCGSMSTFYVQKLLNDYTKEKNNIEDGESFTPDFNYHELPSFEEAQ